MTKTNAYHYTEPVQVRKLMAADVYIGDRKSRGIA
jgi:hypothetical protein